MAKKVRSKPVQLAVYLAVRIVVCVVQALPLRVSFGFAEALAWLGYKLDKRHRLVAAENLRHAFPDWTEAKIDRTVRDCYRHSTKMIVEMTLLPRKFTRGNIHDHVRHAIPELFDATMGIYQKRSAILLTGHFGNWEVLSYYLGMLGCRGGVIARRLDNPYLDAFVNRFRVRTGQRILDKNTDYDKVVEYARSGRGGLGIVGDQDAGGKGVFADFFGRPASTFKSIALLSLEYNLPILVFGTARIADPLKFRIYVPDIIYPEEYAHRPDAAKAITQRFTKALESMIRLHPEQYFWLHRRWKSQPAVRNANLRKAS